MNKATKRLIRFATDGGTKMCFHCPFDLGLPCPRVNTDCIKGVVRSKKFLRKCWRMTFRR